MARLVISGGPMAGLLDMLRYTRALTIKAIEGLTAAQLDHRHDEESNSIGTLLRHIAAVEATYQVETFDGREFNAEERARWMSGIDMKHEAPALPVEHYLATLSDLRERTEREIALRDEEWLLRVWVDEDGDHINNYWKWFHVCEDEISHRGQIRWLRKRLPR